MDEDSLPIRAAPRPLLVGPDRMDSLSDLDVSLTPDKVGKSMGILKKREGPDGDVVRGKASRRQKRIGKPFRAVQTHAGRVFKRDRSPPPVSLHTLQVRFDTGSEPEGCDEEALTPGDPDFREEGASPRSPALASAPEGSESKAQTLANPSSIVTSDRRDKGPALRDSRKVKAARLNEVCKPPRRGVLPGGPGGRGDCPLASPEYNTTLALGQELQQLREAGFDARRAATEQLKRSSVTRQCVEGKVTEGLNVPKDLQRYKGLVSLEVPVDEVLSVAVQEKMLLVKPRAENKKVVGVEAPDLTMFYDPLELLTETPHLSVEGLPALKVQAQPKPAAKPFDLYRKLRQWEA
ncbi:protein phosphatase 1 regulatory subunit 35 [Carcharodon carcharias]|uniref:protein phosphatase 1 regulatory subunit 35 n=1 Tax=Carcharodon carcharias TaxID=13397 RepID=UPI001B7E0B92|nr:protein phosphatase 1 regulatory subunit 35 [Carcharodon carcharias]